MREVRKAISEILVSNHMPTRQTAISQLIHLIEERENRVAHQAYLEYLAVECGAGECALAIETEFNLRPLRKIDIPVYEEYGDEFALWWFRTPFIKPSDVTLHSADGELLAGVSFADDTLTVDQIRERIRYLIDKNKQ